MSQDALQITAKRAGTDDADDIVFLCHNSKDKAYIRMVADALELEFGRRFFLDVFAIPTGEAFIPWIEKALEECAVCAIFLGGNGWGPTHLWEAELALARYRRDPTFRIIPVALPEISLQEAAKLGSGTLFQDINWADFRSGPGDAESLDKFEAALTGRKTLGYRGPARLTPYQMRRDAERWKRSGRKDRSILYSGRQLVEAEALERDNPDAVVVAGVTSFLAASRQRERNFWRSAAIGAIGVALVLLTTAAIAVTAYVLAEQRRLASVSRQLAMASKDAAGADRALLIGARAVLVDDTVPEARGALLEQLQDMRFLRRVVGVGDYVETVGLRPDGQFLIGTADGLQLLSRDSTAPARFNGSGPAQRETITAVLAAEGGVLLGYAGGRVDAVVSGSRRMLIDASAGIPPDRLRRVLALAYDKSKRLIAVGTGSGRIAIVKLSDGSVAKTFDEGVGVRINSLSFDTARPRLAVGTSEGTILLVDTDTFEIVDRYPRIGGGVLALGYVHNGSLAAVGGEGRLVFFDRRNPDLEMPRNGEVAPLATAAAIDPATSRVAVGDSSGTIRLYDAATGADTGMPPLRGHSDAVTAISFGIEKDDLVSASSNGTVALWDLGGQQGPSDELPQFNPSPSAIRTDSAGRIVAVSTENNAEVREFATDGWKLLFDLVSATRQAADDSDAFFRQPERHDGFEEVVSPIQAVAVTNDGGKVAWVTSAGAILARSTADASSRPVIIQGPGHGRIEALTMSGDGQTVAAIEESSGRILLYAGGAPDAAPSPVIPSAPARSVALDHRAARLAAGMTDGRIAQYSLAPLPTPQGKPWLAHTSEVAGLMYSRDGRLIISHGSGGGGVDRSVTISNASGAPDPRSLLSRQAAGSVSGMTEGTNTGLLAAGDHDGQVLMWSAADGRYSGRIAAGTSAVSAVLIDDERHRLITASDGVMLSWSLDPMHWVKLACAKANRSLTPDEWRELLPDDDYVASCSEKRLGRDGNSRTGE
jgi:WD40 repeat protein